MHDSVCVLIQHCWSHLKDRCVTRAMRVASCHSSKCSALTDFAWKVSQQQQQPACLPIECSRKSRTFNDSKWHKNDFKKITRECTMNVPIKKKLQTQITIEFQAGTSIWLDMCEHYVSASALRAHQLLLCAVSLCFAAVMQKSAPWRNLAHTIL